MNKLLRGLCLVGALGLVLGVIALLGARSGSRGVLQRYEAELRAKGEKLTYAELSRGQQTNAFDSHAVLTNAVVMLGEGPLNPGLLEPRRYLSPGQAIAVWKEPDVRRLKATPASRGGTWEEFDAQMREAEGALQQIRKAMEEPELDGGPYTNVFRGRRVNFVAVRKAAARRGLAIVGSSAE